VVYLRPDEVVVFDRVTTIKDSYPKQLRWNFAVAPTVSGDSFVEAVGNSKLFGQSYSAVPLTTALVPVTLGKKTFDQVITQNASPTASVRYVTVFQIAPSTTSVPTASQHVLSGDGRLEGVEIGGQVVLFGRDGDVDLSTPSSYTISGSGPVSQLVTNLQAGGVYQVTADGQVVATVTASAQGTINFTASPNGTQTIQLAKTG
jgi:hypothetical protein